MKLPGTKELPSRLCLAVSELDIMILKTSPEHYLGVGASALQAILSGVPELLNTAPRRILDFGSGYGRVARFLSAQWPEAELRVCDVDFPGIAFCMTHLGAMGFQVGTDPALYKLEPIHDLIWVGSVVTHLDATNIKKLLIALHAGLAPGGYLCFTSHDSYPVERMKTGNFHYCLDTAGIETVVQGYEKDGYGYADYPGVKGYGVSATTPAWITQCADSVGGWHQVAYQPRGWDNHQEVVIYQRDR
jgi:SAM-dependent methyltransferase